MNRIDIKPSDVFISWTSKDRDIKDAIVEHLRKNGLTCLESDHQCSGDIRQWSKEAVRACNIFLLVCSENTFQSTYVPVEIEESKKLDDCINRTVPVYVNQTAFDREHWGVKEYGSAVILGEEGLTEGALSDILYKVNSLNINLLDKIYTKAAKQEYIKIMSLCGTKRIPDKEFDFSELYVNRTITEVNRDGSAIDNYQTAERICKCDDIVFLSGPTGSGKSQYIKQVREACEEDTVAVVLSCFKVSASNDDIITVMYKEFRRLSGTRYFYTQDDFKSLLNNRHLLLVLDGMDEISTVESRRKLIAKVEDYYRANNVGTTLMFTSRNESDADLLTIAGKRVRRFILNKLNDKNIRSLSEKLFLLFGEKEKNDEFYVRVKDLNDEIKANPLLLSQLAIIYDNIGEIPKTIVGIYDAISEIILSFDKNIDMEVPEAYREMVETKISRILKTFSAERYSRLSQGKSVEAKKIFGHILKDMYDDEARERAEFLVEYLQGRAILIDGDFYHKMLLEYFTAVRYYESAFDDYDEIEDRNVIRGLFEHYNDPYWTEVIKMFLVKADSCIDKETTNELYSFIATCDIEEYTVLFDTCRDLIRHKEEAQTMLVADILRKSADGVYPPYGPLFWYVPEYKLYEISMLALHCIKEEPCFIKALALVRDVCAIIGGVYLAENITQRIDLAELYETVKGELYGLRGALCELFLTGNTDYEQGDDIYPRCFNVREAKSFIETGCGVLDKMNTPFEDELGLYSECAFNEVDGEFIGVISCPYDVEEIEKKLAEKSCRKLNGMILHPTDKIEFEYLSFNRNHMSVLYIPENIISLADEWNEGLQNCLQVACQGEKKIYFREVVIIPDGVEIMSENMFSGCRGLKRVFLPDGVTEIEGNAFCGCIDMEFVNIPESVEIIWERAFCGCEKLTSITIPSGVEQIGKEAFVQCFSLRDVKLSEGLKSIGQSAFIYCINLTSISIPDSVEKIGIFAFAGCKTLESVRLPIGITEIDGGTFLECESLMEISIPDGVEKVGVRAFESCLGLSSVHFPETLKLISDSAFYFCYSLQEVSLPEGLEFIRDGAFHRCVSLERVHIPCGVKEIGSGAFKDCRALQHIYVSGTVRVATDAFDDTTVVERDDAVSMVQEDTDIVVPTGTLRIEDRAFFGNRNARRVTIPEGVEYIGEEAFMDCISLEQVVLPETLKEIGGDAFSGCKSLAEVKLPMGIKKINYGTFAGCESIVEIDIPSGVTEIESDAFSECSSLEKAVIPDGVQMINERVFYGCRSLRSVCIPEGIMFIGPIAFSKCEELSSISIPDGVEYIGEGAFSKCYSLKSINIPTGVDRIEDAVFEGCSSLISVKLPEGLKRIDDSAFWGCGKLRSVELPDGVSQIGDSAFWGCESMEKIRIPDSVQSFGESAFFRCRALVSIDIPAEVTEIEAMTFLGCIALKSINLHEGITKIGDSAFTGCESLETVSIPASVRIIGDNAFGLCQGIRTVKISRRFEDDIQRIFGNVDVDKIEFIWF